MLAVSRAASSLPASSGLRDAALKKSVTYIIGAKPHLYKHTAMSVALSIL